MDWNEDAIDRLYADIGAKIRSARKLQDRTQDDLASMVGLTRSSVANIEAGRQRALIHAVVLIGEYLDVEPESLLPSLADLERIASVPESVNDELKGQPDARHDFVNSALRRVAGA